MILVFALGGVSTALPASAHTLSISTARVVLRQNHLEVQAEWDAFGLVAMSPTDVATLPEAALTSVHQRWLDSLAAESKLEVDGRVLPVRVTSAPDRDELRAMAADMSATGRDHGLLVPLRLEGPLLPQRPRQVQWRSPAAVGPVLVSFVQPVTRLVTSGESAGFVVPAPEATPTAPDALETCPPPAAGTVNVRFWTTALASLVLGLAMGAALARRNKGEKSETK